MEPSKHIQIEANTVINTGVNDPLTPDFGHRYWRLANDLDGFGVKSVMNDQVDTVTGLLNTLYRQFQPSSNISVDPSDAYYVFHAVCKELEDIGAVLEAAKLIQDASFQPNNADCFERIYVSLNRANSVLALLCTAFTEDENTLCNMHICGAIDSIIDDMNQILITISAFVISPQSSKALAS